MNIGWSFSPFKPFKPDVCQCWSRISCDILKSLPMASHLKAKSLRIASVIFHPLVTRMWYCLSGLFGYRQTSGWGEILFCWGFFGYTWIYPISRHTKPCAICMFATSQARIHFQCFLDGYLDDHAFGSETCARWLVGNLFFRKEVWRLNSWFKDDLNQRCEEKTWFSHQKTWFFMFFHGFSIQHVQTCLNFRHRPWSTDVGLVSEPKNDDGTMDFPL